MVNVSFIDKHIRNRQVISSQHKLYEIYEHKTSDSINLFLFNYR